MNTILWTIIGVAAAPVFWLIYAYNRFITLSVRFEEAWADIDVQLKRRYDLIPNLIETVKGYAIHEKEAFENVTKARSQALSAQSIHDKEAADNMVTSALKSIFAIAEAYPQLRAVESFTKLQEELSDTENKIQAARRFYNGNVMEYNVKIDAFPSNLVAKFFNFQKKDFFELESEFEKEPVKVKF